MNETEKYGIELEANYSKFTKGLDKAVESSKKASEQIEKNISGINTSGIGEKLSNSVKNAINKISNFRQKMQFDKNVEKAFPETKIQTAEEQVKKFDFSSMSLKELQKELDKTQKRLDTLTERNYKVEIDLKKYDEELDRIVKEYEEDMKNANNKLAEDFALEWRQMQENDLARQYTPKLEKSYNIGLEIDEMKEKEQALNEAIEETKSKASSLGGIFVKSAGEGSRAIGVLQNKFAKITSITNNFGKNFGKTIGKSIKNVRKLVLSMFGIQTAWRAITKAANAYKSIDQDITGKINAAWIGLGSFLAPALEKISDLVIRLVAYLNKLVKYLFGIDFLARAISKSAAKASKNINKALAGIDQITNLDGANGLDNDWTSYFKGLEDVDISPIINFVDKAKALLSRIFDPMYQAWQEKGPTLLDSIRKAFEKIGKLGSHIFDDMLSVWENGAGKRITEYVLQIWTDIFDIIGGIADAFDKAWQHGGQGKSIMESVFGIIENIFKFVSLITDSIKKWVVSESFQKALETVLGFIDAILKVIKKIGDDLLQFYSKYIKPLVDKYILPIISNIITILGKIGTKGVEAFTKIYDKVKIYVKPILDAVYDVLDWALGIIKDISDFVVNILDGNWSKAWDNMKNMVDRTIGSLQTVIDKMKKISELANSKKSSGSGKGGGFSAGDIIKYFMGGGGHAFAEGTNYVPNDQLALIHKGEAIIPKAFNKKEFFNNANNADVIVAIRDLQRALEEKDMNAYISKNDVGKASVDYINSQSRIMGRSVV